MKKGLLFKSVILFVALQACVFNLEAAVILQNSFDNQGSIAGWHSFTNDENRKNGWNVKDGMLFQSEPNYDNVPFGERFLIKPDVFDLDNPTFPIEISFDIFPYDYSGKSEIWFGVALFVNPERPDKGEIVAALRKNPLEGLNGLNLAIGGKRWLNHDRNISESIIQRWHRVRLRLEKEKDILTIHARSWSETEDDPGEWSVTEAVSLTRNPLAGEGFAVCANAHFGDEIRDPRFFFDNLIIADNAENVNVFSPPDVNRGDALRELKQDEQDDLMYREALSKENGRHFGQASEKMKQLKKQFPNSDIAKKVGGLNGRTEDQALNDFLDSLYFYHKQDFKGAAASMEKFLKNYPQNWRKPEMYRRYCFALYHSDDKEKFYEETEKFLKQKIYSRHDPHIILLQAGMKVREGKYEEARNIYKEWVKTYPASKDLRHQFQDLILTTWYKTKEFKQLEIESQRIINNYPEKSREWYRGMVWLGVARMNQTPRKIEEAKPVFDAILDGDLSRKDVDTHLLSSAAVWRIWIALNNDNDDMAQNLVRRVKNELPDGKYKKNVLDRYGHLID